jgi:pimeloyl-ACP methyl ester carboxylesterase
MNMLPEGIRSQIVGDVNGLDVHVLAAGDPAAPCLLLLHGFPELAYSWRHVMLPLAAAGFHVVAPDQRGYGQTTGWSAEYDGDLAPFRILNLAHDAVSLVHALGHNEVAGVVGHDFGSPVAAWSALVRPDVFRAAVLMSAPFGGAPPARIGRKSASGAARSAASPADGALDIHAALAALDPPRKHYQRYFASRDANTDMQHAPQGVRAFLRAYYHMKSGDWPGNAPAPLPAWRADALAQLPEYYVMRHELGMAATVAPHLPDAAQIERCAWLTEAELDVYAAEYARTGFQGGLNWYRAASDRRLAAEFGLFAGRRLTVPACFIAGARDWGIHQQPGALERMQSDACAAFFGVQLITGAGHWVQQERPAEVAAAILAFVTEAGPSG